LNRDKFLIILCEQLQSCIMRLKEWITKKVFFKRKTLIVYYSVLVLPLTVVAYLGFDTLSERHKSTKNILESNLWITGESALNQLERELNNLETNILTDETFRQISAGSFPEGSHRKEETDTSQYNFTLFILTEDLSIAYPLTGTGRNGDFSYGISSSAEFESRFRLAEYQEFQERNYTKALEGYRSCYNIASSKQDHAYALEGLGRVSISSKNYSAADTYYNELCTKYSDILNSAGHPYGIVGLLQLYEINKQHAPDKNLSPEFIDAYEKLKNGFWKLSAPSCRFFISEIESILDSEYLNDPLRQHTFDSLRTAPSSYLEDLAFVEYLRADVIPKISEAQILNTSENVGQIRRTISDENGQWSLISFRKLLNLRDGADYIGGIKWDTDYLQSTLIPLILKRISKDSGLDLNLSETRSVNSSFNAIPENSLLLSFRSYPMPWKLNVVQPAMVNMEKESRKEMVIFSLLLGLVFIMMTLGALLIARDIKRETESMRMKTEFVHNVSHELKTPLSLIRLYGETLLIKKNLTPSENIDALQVITKESERLSHMINNILDFSKIEMRNKEFNFRKGDVVKTLQETLDSYRYHLEKEGFKITEEIAGDIPMTYFDKEAIEGLLINLLSNAIKYSHERKELAIRVIGNKDHILLEVSDRGVGIAPGDLSQIFDRFYRTKQPPGFESRGSGLGLTLVKHIVESHEGSIDVSSEPGKGSTFSMKFPIRKSPHKTKE
jgi:signal transduction histidine kinase